MRSYIEVLDQSTGHWYGLCMEDHSITIKLFENNWITEDQKWEVQRIRNRGECKTYTPGEMDTRELADIYKRHEYPVPEYLQAANMKWVWELHDWWGPDE